MTSYHPPAWSYPPPPQHSWSIEEIKNGIIVCKHSLTRPSTLFGRAADQVDIPTSHPSCSRLHARIAFDSKGFPWLKDLGSGHGTLINKRFFPREMMGVQEDEKKGILVYPGDVIRFGASTRIFCLVGPGEYEREVLKEMMERRKRQKLDGKISSTSGSIAQQQQQQGKKQQLCWNVDPLPQQPQQEKSSAEQQILHPVDIKDLPERHRKTHERYMSKIFKYQHIQRESERILKKGLDDLTPGQKAQLEKNKDRETTLQREIEQLDRQMREKIAASRPPNGTTVGSDGHTTNPDYEEEEEYDDEDDDVDDFYDKTKDDHKKSPSPQSQKPETQESLMEKWSDLLPTFQKRVLECEKQQQKRIALEQKLKSQKQQDDEDAFFLKNDLELATDNAQKALKTKQEIEEELTEIEKLLNVVNPDILIDREKEFVGERKVPPPPPPPPPILTVKKEPPPLKKEEKQQQQQHPDMPPPQPKKPSNTWKRSSPSSPSSSPVQQSKPIKRLIGPTLPPPITTTTTSSTKSKPDFESMPPPLPKPNFRRKVLSKRHRDSSTKVDPSKQDEWKAPSNQDGSGITKLNAKFGGRY